MSSSSDEAFRAPRPIDPRGDALSRACVAVGVRGVAIVLRFGALAGPGVAIVLGLDAFAGPGVAIAFGFGAPTGTSVAIRRGSPSVGGSVLPRERRADEDVRRPRPASLRLGQISLLGELVSMGRGLVSPIAVEVAPGARLIALIGCMVSPPAGLVALIADQVALVGGTVPLPAGLVAKVGGDVPLIGDMVPPLAGMLVRLDIARRRQGASSGGLEPVTGRPPCRRAPKPSVSLKHSGQDYLSANVKRITQCAPRKAHEKVWRVEPTTLLTDLLSSDRLLTPALLIDAQAVDANIEATLSALGGDARRWRPHVKTAKLAWTIERLLAHGVTAFKCATTRELRALVDAGATDVLFAMPLMRASASRLAEIGAEHPELAVSALTDAVAMLDHWPAGVGLTIDLDVGMHRTGLDVDDHASVVALAVLALPVTARGHEATPA